MNVPRIIAREWLILLVVLCMSLPYTMHTFRTFRIMKYANPLDAPESEMFSYTEHTRSNDQMILIALNPRDRLFRDMWFSILGPYVCIQVLRSVWWSARTLRKPTAP